MSACRTSWLNIVAITALTSVAYPALGSVNDCVRITDNTVRLACYDNMFSRSAPQPTADDALAQTISAAEKVMAKRKAPLPTQDIDVNARITQINKTLRNELLLELDNGQVWKQTSPRFLQILEGEEVIIKQARLGGYILTTENGTSTRVKHLE